MNSHFCHLEPFLMAKFDWKTKQNRKKPQFTFHFDRMKRHIFITQRHQMLNFAKFANNRFT